MNEFKIAETETFIKKTKKQEYRLIYSKIVSIVYPQLRKNPFFGPNIKKLKGDYKRIYRFRISDCRLFYTIEKDKIFVIIIDIQKRKDSYR